MVLFQSCEVKTRTKYLENVDIYKTVVDKKGKVSHAEEYIIRKNKNNI